MNALLYAAAVLIWGTTWIAISMQTGTVPVLVSVFYRFAIAGLLMLLGNMVMFYRPRERASAASH